MSPGCPVFGFLIQLRLRPGIAANDFARPFSEFLATRSLIASGDAPTILIAGDGMQATDDDRAAVREWLVARSETAHVGVGPLSDVGSAA